MDEKVRKLLSIASEALGPRVTSSILSVNDVDEGGKLELSEMLGEKNGFYAFASALHVFPSGNSLSGRDTTLEEWNAKGLWRFQYDDLPDEILFFAEDLFGVQFCLYGQEVFVFDPESENLSFFAKNIIDWASKILEDYDYFTGYSLGDSWQKENGALPQGYRLLPRMPFILGGKFEADNLYLCEAAEGMRLRGEFAKKIKNLPDGSKINIEVGS